MAGLSFGLFTGLPSPAILRVFSKPMQKPFEGGTEAGIVYEDGDFLGVYKPCRLHSSPQGEGGPDLCSWLFAQRPSLAFDSRELRGGGAGRPSEGGLFHRLDYETSGLVLFAKDGRALKALLEAQAADRVAKDYLAQVKPSLEILPGSKPDRATPGGLGEEDWSRDLADAMRGGPGLEDLAGLVAGQELACRFRPYGPGGAKVACLGGEARPGGKHSRGSPERVYASSILMARAEGGERSLLLGLRLTRGFRHQLRAQLAWLGLPIMGDLLYGSLSAPRLYLEARSLTLGLADRAAPLIIRLD